MALRITSQPRRQTLTNTVYLLIIYHVVFVIFTFLIMSLLILCLFVISWWTVFYRRPTQARQHPQDDRIAKATRECCSNQQEPTWRLGVTPKYSRECSVAHIEMLSWMHKSWQWFSRLYNRTTSLAFSKDYFCSWDVLPNSRTIAASFWSIDVLVLRFNFTYSKSEAQY